MLTPTEKIWHNGRFIAWDDAKIHVLSHVVSYGSSVFEGIRCYETTSGPAIFRLREYLRRMFDSAKIYRMDFHFTPDELAEATLTGSSEPSEILLYSPPSHARLRPYGR